MQQVSERIALGIAAFLFFGSATIGFKWVTSPYLWGYLAAGFGFVALSFLIKTFA
ncbi:MAG: hypothetical protein ACRDG9_15245 [Actinomycetota bacterium]